MMKYWYTSVPQMIRFKGIRMNQILKDSLPMPRNVTSGFAVVLYYLLTLKLQPMNKAVVSV